MINAIDIDSNQLIDELDSLGVYFLQGGTGYRTKPPLNPATLLGALATSHEARLRLALIPLLLQYPALAIYTRSVAEQLPPPAQVGFKCYYTAAQLLQQKYLIRLETLFGQSTQLPDLFTSELGLPDCQSPEAGLQALAERQRSLSGRAINWLGTYEHGAQRLLTHQARRQTWRT